MEPSSTQSIRQAQPARMAELIDLEASGDELDWGPDDLASILRHRLQSHSGLDQASGGSGSAGSEPNRFPLPSLQDLFQQDRPSHDELERVKNWSRASRLEREPKLPPQVSTLLFYTAVAGALVRLGDRLIGAEELDDDALLRGLRWAAAQTWADESSRELCRQAADMLPAADQGEPSDEDASGLPSVGAMPGDRTAAEAPEVPGYDVSVRLGEGAMGTVWRAVQRSTRREVALKLIAQGFVGSHRARLRFDREVELAARLEHPNVARVYDSGVSRGVYHYAMELVEGRHLDRYVREEKLNTRRILALMKEVCQAVQYAHQRGVIHRDLKPSNILVTNDGVPKVLDFGLAKALNEAQDGSHSLTLTQEGQFAGTPAFMAPEQAAGDGGRIDTRTDVYGLGATLYLLLLDRHPHDTEGGRLEVLRRIVQEDVRLPRLAFKKIGRELEAMLLKALDRDPERRYASAGDLAEDIDRYLSGEPLVARPPTLAYALRKRLRKHWPVIAASAVVLTLLTGTGVYSYLRVLSHSREAKANAREALLGQAEGMITQAEALGALNLWGEAHDTLDRAHGLYQKLGEPEVAVDLAEWHLYQSSLPPICEWKGHDGPVTDLVASLEYAISGGRDGTMRWWGDVFASTQPVRTINVGSPVRRLAMSPDAEHVACAAGGTSVGLWRCKDGAKERELTGFSGEAACVAFSPDGKLLLVGTTSKEWNLYLFDPENGTIVRRLKGHGSGVTGAAFSADGKRLFTCSGSGGRGDDLVGVEASVRAWDLAEGRQLWQTDRPDQNEAVSDLTVLRLRSLIACAAGGRQGTVVFLDTDTGAIRHTMSVGRETAALRVAPLEDRSNWSSLGTTTADGTLRVNRVKTENDGVTTEMQSAYATPLGSGAVTSLTAYGAFYVSGSEDGSLRLWSPFATDSEYLEAPPEASTVVSAVALSPDARLGLTASQEDGSVRAWDLATRHELANGRVATRAPPCIAFGPGGGTVFGSQDDGSIAVWDTYLRDRLRTLGPHGDRVVRSFSLSEDGRRLLASFTGSADIVLWDANTGQEVRTWTLGQPADDSLVRLSPDGRLAAAAITGGADPFLKVWDTGRSDELYTLGPVALPGRLNAIAISPDGKLIACGGEGYVRLFELATGGLSKALQPRGVVSVKTAIFSPDGRYLFTAGGGGPSKLTIWNVASSSRVQTWDIPSWLRATNEAKDLAVVGSGGNMLLLAPVQPQGVDARYFAHIYDFGWPARERATRSGEAGTVGTPPTTQASAAEQVASAERMQLFSADYAAVNRFATMTRNGVSPPAKTFASYLWRIRDVEASAYVAHAYRRALAASDGPQDSEYLQACLRAVARQVVATLNPVWVEAAAPGDGFLPGRGFFRTEFTAPPKATADFAELWLDADTHTLVYLNGTQVYPPAGANLGRGAVSVDVTPFVRAGRNVLAVQASNDEGTEAKGLRLRLDVIPHIAANLAVPKSGRWKCSAVVQAGWQNPDFEDSAWHAAALDPALQKAEPTGPSLVPGRVQAEAYGAGGEGVGYHDVDSAEVTHPVAYRRGGVGIDECGDEGRGLNVGHIVPGEWLAYSLEVTEGGTFNLGLRLASGPATGGVLHVELDGKDVTGPVSVPHTLDWQTWQTVTLPGMRLDAGRRTLRVVFDKAGAGSRYVCNFDWFEFRAPSADDAAGSATTRPVAAATDSTRAQPHEPRSPASIPARVQAEAFDPGGEGFAYHDNEPEQIGVPYRPGGVDFGPNTDDGGGFNIGYICPGEWLAYTLEVAETGEYELDLRLASISGGASLHVDFDGKDLTGPVAVPDTSDWGAWRTVSAPRIRLEKGRRVMRVCFDRSNSVSRYVCNFNWFELRRHQATDGTRPAPLEK